MSSEHEQAKCESKSVVATRSQGEYKDYLLHNKCLRHSVNRISDKNHKMETYEINKCFLSCFVDEIYTLNNGYNELSFGY